MATRPILIVEDEENDLFFLVRAMQKAGISNPVQSVTNGQEAIDYIKGEAPFEDRIRYPLPLLVLLDLKLPCVNGLDVLRWIRQQPGHISNMIVLVLTSSTLANDIEEAYKARANGYIAKPADPDQLVRTMQDLAAWWLKRNVPPF